MRKFASIQKIAWKVALRFATVKDHFEYHKDKLVKNPNPHGIKEWVTQEYADQFLNRGKQPSKEQTPSSETPKPGKDRAAFNKKRIAEIKASGKKNSNKFDDLDQETRKRVETIIKKPGAQVTKEDVDTFVNAFKTAFEETKSWHEKFFSEGGAEEYAGRLKDENSLLTKMNGRFAKRSLETVGDIVGNRCICKNAQDQKRLVNYIYENCVILEHDDSVEADIRPDGYRAHHFTLQSSDGRLIELQVKTPNQQIYSGFTHRLYKSALKGDAEVIKYTKALSDYIYEVDSGKTPKNRPQAPEKLVKFLKDNGLSEFDFDELERA
jgi:ppGpp synthetase/RelA/SpoT-type nucleotidyltranferase